MGEFGMRSRSWRVVPRASWPDRRSFTSSKLAAGSEINPQRGARGIVEYQDLVVGRVGGTSIGQRLDREVLATGLAPIIPIDHETLLMGRISDQHEATLTYGEASPVTHPLPFAPDVMFVLGEGRKQITDDAA